MIAKSIFDYFFFGTALRYLQDAKVDFPIHTDEKGGMYILSNIKEFLKNLDQLNLQVTKRAVGDLIEFSMELEESVKDSKLSIQQAVSLSDMMNKLRPTLVAELQGFFTYVVTPKRFEVEKLLNDIDALFAPESIKKIPKLAYYDLSEAGKCIAFERSTAAAFHLLRATECVFRELYCIKVKRNRCQLMWGPMVSDLRKRKNMKKEISLLNNLDDIRLTFRNPTQHPEKIYDIQEVQDLFGRSIDAINRMAKELPAVPVM